MADDEMQLSTLVDAWRKAVQMRLVCPTEQQSWWEGFIAGTAMAIAAVSGLPPGGSSLSSTIAFGCEIARARP